MPETFLMCEPKYFDVDYVINPWMKGQVHKIDHALAKEQWQNFYKNLQQVATVELIKPEPNMPDLVFTANAGLILNKQVILSHFRPPERRPEESVFKRWFEEQGYSVSSLPDDIYFEGHGDALFHSNKKLLWSGYGIRTEPKALDALKKQISIPLIPLELIDEKFYHLDTCLCPLLDNFLIYYPPAFSKESNQLIEATVPKQNRIAIGEEDAAHFACNLVLARTNKIPGKKGVLFVNAITSKLQAQLEALGYQVQIQPVTEFRKAGGGNQCLTLKLAHK